MYPTELITKIDIREPRFVVVIPVSGPTVSPWKVQEIVRGSSPELTMQESWAKSPSFMTGLEKENSPISGSSETDRKPKKEN